MRRTIGLTLLGLGVALIAWVAVVVVSGDPVTSLYTSHEQHLLERRLARLEHRSRIDKPEQPAVVRGERSNVAQIRVLGRAFRRRLHDGDPIGRIAIPKLDLKMVVVQGTSSGDLEKGPGHYDAQTGRNTSLPGLGGVVAIAGHRTTFLHPFRHIDDLRPGDRIYLEMPYGTFRYRVYHHKVVLPSDWSILRPRPYEKLVLTACEPLYSASHRYVVFARLEGAGQAMRSAGPS